ncbi:hypothetical protein HDC90_004510 [Pedobacter sp. AK013]|uniref:hypothetical protein n=1 Tax=Pedobacter sp. AK013 TaxID=2723071 RepID=UPI001621D0E7|nr:hypothetical protein [Pedobacter sp. AK013]MBB6239848.1 hypothetical protein [Pedobacter sp. AK013]
MKVVFLIVKSIVILLLIIDLLFWMMAHASGHIIPSKTNWAFGLSSGGLILVLILLNIVSKKVLR